MKHLETKSIILARECMFDVSIIDQQTVLNIPDLCRFSSSFFIDWIISNLKFN